MLYDLDFMSSYIFIYFYISSIIWYILESEHLLPIEWNTNVDLKGFCFLSKYVLFVFLITNVNIKDRFDEWDNIIKIIMHKRIRRGWWLWWSYLYPNRFIRTMKVGGRCFRLQCRLWNTFSFSPAFAFVPLLLNLFTFFDSLLLQDFSMYAHIKKLDETVKHKNNKLSFCWNQVLYVFILKVRKYDEYYPRYKYF